MRICRGAYMKVFGWTLAALMVASGAALAQNDDVRVIVRFNGHPDGGLLERHGGRTLSGIYGSNAVVGMLPPGQAARLRRNPNVAAVVVDGIVQTMQDRGKAGKPPKSSTPPPESVPWGVSKIRADVASNRDVEGIVVAVLDTGVDRDHPDLAGRLDLLNARDFTSETDGTVEDGNGHGTHVSGTVAAVEGNGIGVVGVAPRATVLPIQVLNASGSGQYSWIESAINYVAGYDAGTGAWGAPRAHVVNMSLGGGDPNDPDLNAAFDAAFSGAGILLVAASGNEDASSPSYPAKLASVVAVGATDSSDANPDWANLGAEVWAPGVSIPSTYKGDGYSTLSGTSMASPHAAGAAALVIAGGKDAVNARAILKNTGVTIPLYDWPNPRRRVSAGTGVRIDAQAAAASE